MSKEAQVGLSALPLIITLLFLFFAEQKIKTFGELFVFLSNISLISSALIASILFFVFFVIHSYSKKK